MGGGGRERENFETDVYREGEREKESSHLSIRSDRFVLIACVCVCV